jgi:pimeloyl-ACP methyl ester carboxylesterase
VPARLHHERIARSDSAPARWLALTHGFFGAGSNWRSIARKLTERRPEWGVVLVDLRQHGRSEPGEPPHTIAACADDLRALVAELGDVRAIAGHSFGGKVVLATRGFVDVSQTWVLDASPSRRREPAGGPPGTVERVLALMERSPRVWARRDDFVAAVVETVAMRRGCPAKHPSPRKSPLLRIATTASLPCIESTVVFTLPLWI